MVASVCAVATPKTANCFLLACILSGSLPFRTPFSVSNLFISQDPRLSYLHVHCKCNVNESSDKIFLYFVISKEFLYGRLSETRMPSASSSCSIQSGQDHHLFLFFYTNLLHVSETFFKGVYSIWLFVAKKNKHTIILSKAFYALVHLKEPSLSPLPPSVECILYEVVVIFLIANITFAH